MRTKFQVIKGSLLATLLMLFSVCLQAQVTIGSSDEPHVGAVLDLQSTEKGLLLPRVELANVNSFAPLTEDAEKDAKGMVVYNTKENVIGGTGTGIYSWDGSKWSAISASGGSMITEPAILPEFTKDGGSEEIVVSNPVCDIAGNYLFTVIAGEAMITPEISADGKFMVTFGANPSAASRKSIVLVTDPCGNTATLIFEQEGDDSFCNNTVIVPDIATSGTTNLCAGGAVFLYLNGTIADAELNNYIWVKGGVEVGRGKFYEARSTGTYTVYYGGIGCSAGNKSINITSGSSNYTGSTASILVDSNNGYVCGPEEQATLIAVVSNPEDEYKIVWFKDGVLQDNSAYYGKKTISAGVGQWQIAVRDGNCFSVGSRVVTVQVSPSAGGGQPAPFTINAESEICRNGNIIARVDVPENDVTYTWYANNILLGTGAEITVAVPSEINALPNNSEVYIRCQAKKDGCSIEIRESKTLQIGANIPSANITSNTNGVICDGSTVLSVTNSGGYTVKWYISESSATPVHTGVSYNVTAENTTVYAELWSGSCAGRRVAYTTKTEVSNRPIVSWDIAPTTANINESTLYAVRGYNLNNNVRYLWSVEGDAAATISGQGQPNVYITFRSDGIDRKVNVIVSNDCGSAAGLSQTVTVGTVCEGVSTVSIVEGTSTSAYVGVNFRLHASAFGGTGITYKWYLGGTEVGTGSEVTLQAATADPRTYTVKAWAACETEAEAKTASILVNVTSTPDNITEGANVTFSGTTCFDIKATNYASPDCGTWESRIGHNFATTPSVTYKFTPSTTVTNVRYVFINNNASVPLINNLTNATPGNVGIDGHSVNVNFNTNLNETAKLLSGNAAPKATLYVIYSSGGNEYRKSIVITVQDCACCGAMTNTGWLTFMCHNLGADESLDPFTPNQYLHGDKYRFGAQTASYTMDLDQTNASNITNWNNTTLFPYQATGNWSDFTNPCPSGWRVPTDVEWTQVINKGGKENNAVFYMGVWTLSSTNYSSGVRIGNRLFLPAAGFRLNSGGGISNRGGYGYYWSTNGNTRMSVSLGRSLEMSTNTNDRMNAFSVRCVSAQ